jgi:hypothetical protein
LTSAFAIELAKPTVRVGSMSNSHTETDGLLRTINCPDTDFSIAIVKIYRMNFRGIANTRAGVEAERCGKDKFFARIALAQALRETRSYR